MTAPTTTFATTTIEPVSPARDTTADPAWIRPWLRAEGAAVLAAGLVGFLALGLPWWLFVAMLIGPDLSMVGYLRGPRLGAITYNVVHDLATGAIVAGLGLAIGSVPLAAIGAILVAHSGMDRLAGYGLKFPTSFHDTHLGRIGRDRRP